MQGTLATGGNFTEIRSVPMELRIAPELHEVTQRRVPILILELQLPKLPLAAIPHQSRRKTYRPFRFSGMDVSPRSEPRDIPRRRQLAIRQIQVEVVPIQPVMPD